MHLFVLASILTNLPSWYWDQKRYQLACKLAGNMVQRYYRIHNLLDRTRLVRDDYHAVFWRRSYCKEAREIRVEVSTYHSYRISYDVTMWLYNIDNSVVTVSCPKFHSP